MARHLFPGGGHDGDQPVPGVPARDDADGDRYLDRLAGEIDAGRVEVPPEEPPPGPVPGALTAQAAGDVASLPDEDLLGVISAARRQQARAEYEELAAVAEFTRRGQQYAASRARGDKPRQRDGGRHHRRVPGEDHL